MQVTGVFLAKSAEPSSDWEPVYILPLKYIMLQDLSLYSFFLRPFLNSSLGTFSNSREIPPQTPSTWKIKSEAKDQIRKEISSLLHLPSGTSAHLPAEYPKCLCQMPCAQLNERRLLRKMKPWMCKHTILQISVVQKVNLEYWFICDSTQKKKSIAYSNNLLSRSTNSANISRKIFAFKLQLSKRATVLFQIKQPFAKVVLHWTKRIIQNRWAKCS